MSKRYFSRCAGRVSRSILTLCLLAAAVVPAAAQEVQDNFNDNAINSTLWSAGVSGTGTQVNEINQQLEISFTPDAQGDSFSAGYGSKFLLQGDFDAQVDFHLLNWPHASGVRVGLGINDAAVERISFGTDADFPGEPRESYLTHLLDGVNGITETGDQSGKLRFVRAGGMATGYYWDAVNSQWVEIHTGPVTPDDVGIGISAWSHDYAFTDQAVHMAFDNFIVNAQGIVGVGQVPEPGALAMLCGLLGGAGLLARRRR